jgi:hypothetical protein
MNQELAGRMAGGRGDLADLYEVRIVTSDL